jgi:hypothetical protein
VGEADVARARLDQHVRHKDFWTALVLFTSKDGSLNKAHVKYLESRLVALAREAGRADLENGNTPQPPRLSEVDRAEAEAFLQNMLLAYPLLGLRAFERPDAHAVESTRLHLSTKGIRAEGREAGDEFVVFAGSGASRESAPSSPPGLKALRDHLVQQGVLVGNGPDYRFARDYVFGSPSTAAGVLAGRAANGREMVARRDRPDPEGAPGRRT